MSIQEYSEQQNLFRILDETASWNRTISSRAISSRSERDIRFGIDRVRHLFSFLQIRKQYVQCRIADTVRQALILDIKQNLAVLYMKDLQSLKSESLYNFEIEFYYSNIQYQFDVLVAEIRGNHICIYIPDEIQSVKRRETERVLVNDLFIRFTIAYPPVSRTPFKRIHPMDSRLYGPFAPIVEELEKDEPKLDIIYTEITDQIKKMGFGYDLHIYSPLSESEPKAGSLLQSESKENPLFEFIEEAIRKERKTFFIADSKALESYSLAPREEALTNLHKAYEELEGESAGKGQAYCQEIQNEDKENFIRSYACAPLIAFDSLLGHIKIFSTTYDYQIVSIEEAKTLDLLAQFLSYAIIKLIITRKYYYNVNTRIRNISRGGLFLEVEDKKILDYLLSHIYLKITLEVEEHILNIKARVTQYYHTKELGKHGLGVQFYKVDPDTDLVLANIVYEHKRNELKASLA